MTQSFTDKLYESTKDAHTSVDKHPFVSLIRKNKRAGEMYIDFNKICIHEIQKVLYFEKLYRDIQDTHYTIQTTPTLQKLLDHCKRHPLESAYQLYLGLLFGGNMLKRMLPDHSEFLTYDDPKELIKDFKAYLCTVPEIEQDAFIANVNACYVIIHQLFDEFYSQIERENAFNSRIVDKT